MNKRLIKITKWFLGIVLGIILLITGGLYLFKDDICGYVVSEVNKHLKAKVSVSSVDLTFWGSFPNLSVDFNNVFIQDSYANSTKRDTLLFSEQIRLEFNPLDIWREDYQVKSIQVKPGTIQLKVRDNGEVNYDILQPTEDTTTTKFKLDLKLVALENVRFSYENEATGQQYLTNLEELDLDGNFTETEFTLHAKSNLHVDKARSGNVTLISNKPASFDINLLVNKAKGTFQIPNALVYVANLPFQLKGNVTKENLSFEVHSKDIHLVDVVNNFSLAQMDEIKKFDGTGKVYFDLFVDGENNPTAATQINCDFGIENGTLTEPIKKLKIKNIHLDGRYSNVGGAEKEFLHLSGVRFTTPGGPFSGDLRITQFQTPNYRGIASGNLHLYMVHSLFHIPYVENVHGNLGVKTNFNIQSIPQEDESMDYAILKCEGEVTMKKVLLKLIDDKRTFKDLNGSVYLRNDEAGVDNVTVNVGASDLAVSGVFKNIIPYFKRKGKITADVEIKSRFIDVQDLGTTTKEEKIQDGRKFVMPDDIDGKAILDIGAIKYETHHFKNLSGNMLLGNRKIYFPNIKLRNADADIIGNLVIEERSPEIFTITTNIATDNLHFKPLFKEWNNFQQDVISENNISGKAKASVYFEAPFDLRSGIISKSIKSEIYINIQDGRLKNVEAFKLITESLRLNNSAKLAIGAKNIAILDKKLVDLKFENLENTLIISNGKMVIPMMRIQSSALDVDVSGTHTFENKIDYHFAFRFRDLKEKDRKSEFGEEIDDGTGMHVFMRMYGNLDNPTIEWDKSAKKAQKKENIEQEKQNVKSILKSEFGLFKGDSSVRNFEQKPGLKEEIHIEFGPIKTEDPIDTKKQKKDSKIRNTLKGWKEEADESKKEAVKLN